MHFQTLNFLAIDEDERRVDLPLKLPDGEMPQRVASSATKMADTANGNDAILRQPMKAIAERIGIAERCDGDDGEAAFLHIGSRHPVLKDTLKIVKIGQVDPKRIVRGKDNLKLRKFGNGLLQLAPHKVAEPAIVKEKVNHLPKPYLFTAFTKTYGLKVDRAIVWHNHRQGTIELKL